MASIRGIHIKCDFCKNDIYKMQSRIYEHNFCNGQCQHKYYENKTTKLCEYCNKEFEIKKSKEESARFCSNDCKNKWQSENLIGENSPSWKGGLLECECTKCKKLIKIKPYRDAMNVNNFCSYECRDEYYSIKENRTEKQKKADVLLSKNAIKYIKPSLTFPHKIILSVLEECKINYRIEELIKYYRLDIYLYDFNLAIEIQGDFWHSNPNRFNKLKYRGQTARRAP